MSRGRPTPGPWNETDRAADVETTGPGWKAKPTLALPKCITGRLPSASLSAETERVAACQQILTPTTGTSPSRAPMR